MNERVNDKVGISNTKLSFSGIALICPQSSSLSAS